MFRRPGPDTNMRGPTMAPMLIRSRMATSAPSKPVKSHRGDARFQCLYCVCLGQKNRHRGVPGWLVPWIGARGRIPIVGQVRVRIDHSRHAGVAAQIDDLRSRWDCPVRVDTLNSVVLDDDDGIGPTSSRTAWRGESCGEEASIGSRPAGDACAANRMKFRYSPAFQILSKFTA